MAVAEEEQKEIGVVVLEVRRFLSASSVFSHVGEQENDGAQMQTSAQLSQPFKPKFKYSKNVSWSNLEPLSFKWTPSWQICLLSTNVLLGI